MYPEKVKLVIKNFPLSSHPFARKAAKAALSAMEQGKFWEFHHKLFENYKTINDAKIQDIAKALDLDMDAFNNGMNSSAVKFIINRDIMNAREIGVRGTPTIFINGKRLKNRSLSGLTEMIESELKKK